MVMAIVSKHTPSPVYPLPRVNALDMVQQGYFIHLIYVLLV